MEEDYARAAEQLGARLQGSGVLTNDDKVLLGTIKKMSSVLEVHNDDRLQQNAHRRAEEQLQHLLAHASSESAAMIKSRGEVAAAETEASLMVEDAQQVAPFSSPHSTQPLSPASHSPHTYLSAHLAAWGSALVGI
jgi:hypothetical protein